MKATVRRDGKAFNLGRKAAQTGYASLQKNPYARSSKSYMWWRAGYYSVTKYIDRD